MAHKYPVKPQDSFELLAYLNSEERIAEYFITIEMENNPARLQEAVANIREARRRMAEKKD
jgi:hypothetical protein